MRDAVVLYSAVDNLITRYRVNVDAATLDKQETIQAASRVQYAWRHPSLNVLYVTTSSAGPHIKSEFSHVAAYGMDEDGRLSLLGSPKRLPDRAVHMCVDPKGKYILCAHNFPESGITVDRIEADGSIGNRVEQTSSGNFGIYPHQVMAFPSGNGALLIDRGNNSTKERQEEPGALRSYVLDDGQLAAHQVVAPDGGFGFGPRHIDFHPSGKWLYASDERTNSLHTFRVEDDFIEPRPISMLPSLHNPERVHSRQLAGPIHVHPGGRWVYLANRADGSVDRDGIRVFTSGENNIAVYEIDSETGIPSLRQHIDTESFHVRTFSCDPSGRLLVAASVRPLGTEVGGNVEIVPATLSVFRIQEQGQLEFIRKYNVSTEGGEMQYWSGLVPLQ
ncbi:beta-propeller fold lactonase family protein [Cupriavidus sp. CV2]|uniref:lactonase family protein n=1 Tax=Cupriavidus ulmosensis TaxID=3065913 RepID=UPI00296A9B1A|nr:beta-propeller fold lactonase family protein [Cupriavidus sp. CV2]MDW3682809.1 beta-propeller fold lactonase family protein [Cupriavidus sp. CV2]